MIRIHIKYIADGNKDDNGSISIENGVFQYNITKKLDEFNLAKTAKAIYSKASSCMDKSVELTFENVDADLSAKLFLLIKAYNATVNQDKQIEISAPEAGTAPGLFTRCAELFPEFFEIVRLPINIQTPDVLADKYVNLMSKYGIKDEVRVDIFEQKEGDIRFPAIHSVGKGSVYTPRLLVFEFGNNSTSQKMDFDVCLIGKGVAYDTGGISLKPSHAMMEMNCDMAGSALAIFSGLAMYLTSRKPILVMTPIVENAISNTAYRPADIIDSYSGKKIQILNTDAEGRVILTDAITYATKNYSCKHVITLATLTGAANVICGPAYTPYMSNSDEVATQVEASRAETGERVCRQPNDDIFLEGYVNSATQYADIANTASDVFKGFGANTAGPFKFLEYFVHPENKISTYTHFDVANFFDHIGVNTALSGNSRLDMLELVATLATKLTQ